MELPSSPLPSSKQKIEIPQNLETELQDQTPLKPPDSKMPMPTPTLLTSLGSKIKSGITKVISQEQPPSTEQIDWMKKFPYKICMAYQKTLNDEKVKDRIKNLEIEVRKATDEARKSNIRISGDVKENIGELGEFYKMQDQLKILENEIKDNKKPIMNYIDQKQKELNEKVPKASMYSDISEITEFRNFRLMIEEVLKKK